MISNAETICVKCEDKRKQKAEPRKKEQKKILEKSGLYRERQSADPLTQALFEDNAIQDSCRKDNMGSIKPRDESLARQQKRQPVHKRFSGDGSAPPRFLPLDAFQGPLSSFHLFKTAFNRQGMLL